MALAAASGYAAEPDATAILEAARLNPLGQNISLNAQLRTGTTATPFLIVVEEGAVHYRFADPAQELVLELGEDAPRLTERIGGKTTTVRPARFDEALRGSRLSYEDISLQFLYWRYPKVIGDDVVRTRPAWKIEVQAPRGGASQYGVARLWIDKESGALLRVEGYNMQGRMTRRFEVISAQKLGDQWMLKQMRIEEVDPDTKKVTGRSYLEVLSRND